MRVFWLTATILFAISLIISFKKNRKIITVPNIICISTTLNFILYLQGWSKDFTVDCQDVTYLVIGVVEIIFSMYALLNNKIRLENRTEEYYLRRIKVGRHKLCLSSLILIICILLTLFEAVYLTGSIIQTESGRFHTSSMPVVGTIVRGLYPIAYISAYLDWKKYKKKTTPLLALVCVVYSLVALGSRFWTVISVLSVCFFIVEYEKNLIDSLSIKAKIGICLVAYIAFSVFLQLGVDRVGENHVYMDLISYSGPFRGNWFGTIISWFYGYFPYSFYNLNVTLKHILEADICTYGQFLVYPYVSFLHLDGLLGIDYEAMTKSVRIITNTAATVATGYFEFFSDFRYFFFIGLLVMVFITWRYEKKRNLSGLIGFSSMETVWFLMSFNNNYTVGITIYVFFFAWIIQHFFAREYDDISVNVKEKKR